MPTKPPVALRVLAELLVPASEVMLTLPVDTKGLVARLPALSSDADI